MSTALSVNLYLHLEATGGNSDRDIARSMVAYATHLSVPVVVDFNGHDMVAYPGEAAEKVLARLWDKMERTRR